MIGAFSNARAFTTRMLVLTTAFLSLTFIAGCGSSGSSGGGGISGTAISGTVTTGGSSSIAAPGLPPGSVGAGVGAAVASATVEALDADGNVVASTTSGADGSYTLNLPDGTYDIGIRVGSVNEFIPLRTSVIVRGTSIDGTVDVSGTPTLDIDIPEASGQSLTGTVTNDNTSNPIEDVTVEFIDSESGLVRFRTTTDASGAYSSTTLPVGSFVVRLDQETLSSGLVAPSPKTVSVTASAISPSTLDFAAVTATSVSGTISTASGVAPIAAVGPEGIIIPAQIIEVPVTIQAGAEVIIYTPGEVEVARYPLAIDGTFALDLNDGTYILVFEGFASDTVAPAPQRITVQGGLIYTEDSDTPIDPSSQSLASAASDVSATLTGTVTRNAEGVSTRVFAIDPSTLGVLAEADTGADGTFALPLSDGSYDLVLAGNLPKGVIPPNPIRVTVEAGADPGNPIKEDSATPDDGDITIVLRSSSVNLSGFVLDFSDNTITFPDVRVVARKGDKVVARATTDIDGAYTLNLPVGTIDISLRKASIPEGFLPIKPIRLEVSVVGGVASIVDTSGSISGLDFQLVARSPNVTGTVTYDFDASSTIEVGEEVGCTVVVTSPGSTEVLFETATDPATGAYSLVLPNGTYNVGLASTSLPPGTAAPAPTRVSVTATGVTLADGTTGASATVDMELIARAATLTGTVTLNARGVPVELILTDSATGRVVTTTSSLPLSGAYRMPVYQGSYTLKINPTTLPTGTATPTAVNLSVAADGTINTATAAAVPSVDFILTRTVVALSGTISVVRGSDTLPVEAFVQVRDPSDNSVLLETLSDPETGDYSLLLLAGSYEIAVDSTTLPPGVIAPAPVPVTVTTSIAGPGVSGNVLDLALNDTRTAGVTISGWVFDAGGTNAGVPAILRVYDPFDGNAIDGFLYEVPCADDGSYSFVALDGTLAMSILPESLPPTAIPPAPVNFSVQGSNVVENNVLDDPGAAGNAANDGTINLSFQDAANQGITVTGVVQEPGGNDLPFIRVIARNPSTGEIVAESFTNPNSLVYSMLLPLGSYSLEVDPFSLPFDPTNVANNLLAPSPKSVLAIDNTGIVVTTGGGTVVTPDGSGDYLFDFFPLAASQSLTGTVVDSSANPVGVVLRVLDSNGNQVRQRFAEGGNFAFQLPPGAYNVRVVANSVPFGEIAPAPISCTVTSAGIIESNGTEDDGVIAFTLLSGAQTISGTVTDSATLPIGCFVRALDALTGEFVGGAPTNPVTGSYSFTLPVGSYTISVDPGSLPVGYIPPSSVTVQVSSGVDITGQDFVVAIATASITGDVLNDSGIVIPTNVILDDASTGAFVASTPTNPADGTYSISAPPGSYLVKVNPNSLPDGAIAPPAVVVQITAAGTFLEDDTTGSSNIADDGVVKFRIVEPADLETLSGNVTLSTPGGTFPLGVNVIVENASDNSFVNSDFSDPASGGAYSINLETGTYRVRIQPSSLPPGVPTPSPVVITVNTTADSITKTVQGLPVDSSTLDFALEISINEIDGTVTLLDSGGSPVGGFPCVIRVTDPDTDFVLHTQPTDANGNFTLQGPDGTYRIAISPNSLPAGFIASAATTVTASSGLIIETSGTANDGVLDFTVSENSTTLTGSVADTDGADLFCFVDVFDASTGLFLFGVPSQGPNGYSLALLDGTYDISVAPPSLPLNAVPPSPTRITVDSTATPPISVVTSGAGTLTGSDLATLVTLATLATEFDVQIEDDSSNPLPGLVRIRDANGSVVKNVNVPPSGTATLSLSDGNYTAAVVASSVPPGLTVPDPIGITVGGGAVIYTNGGASAEPTIITCTSTTLIGTIFGAVDTVPTPAETLVELQLLDGNDNVLNTVSLTQSGSDATYSTNLSTGTYKLRVVRASGVTANDVLLPQNPVTVTVAGGVIQNPDDDPVSSDVDVDIELPTIAATVSGTITIDAAAVGAGLVVIAKNPTNGKTINSITTDGSGNYALALPAGVMGLGVQPASLANLYPTAIFPVPFPISVSAAGTVTNLETSVNGTTYDFAMMTFDASLDAEIRGTVTSRQSSTASETAVAGANVFLLNANGEFLASAITDANGEYSLFPPDGVGSLTVDLTGIQISYPVLNPLPVQISANGTAVAETNTLGFDPTDGTTANAENDGIVNFRIEGASLLLTGKVQTEDGAGVGTGLVITSASATGLPPFPFIHFTAPDGTYAIPVGTGAYKLWVEPNTVPEGFITPNPSSFTVSGGTINESNTAGSNNVANDGVINPILETGGALVYGRLVDSSANPLPGFIGLFEEPANPNDPPFFIAGMGANPSTGDFAIPIGNGSFFLEVEPFSLPPDQQSPDRVYLSVDGTTVTFAAGVDTVSDVFGSETGALLATTSASTAITGTVLDATANPVAAFIEIFDAANGAFVTAKPCDPATGNFSALVGDGTFTLKVDPFSLPPGAVGPPPVNFAVDGGTITESNATGFDPADGTTPNAANDGIINFILNDAGATLTGIVRDASSNPVGAFVAVFTQNASGDFDVFATGQESSFTDGTFSFPLPDGTYKVGVEPGSVPPGLGVPDRVTVTVSGSTITFGPSAETESGDLIFELAPINGGVQGQILNGSGDPVQAVVIVERAVTNEFIAAAGTGLQGNYSIPLAPGNYRIFIDPPSLPQGAVAPVPTTITVSDSFVTKNWTVSNAAVNITGHVLLPLNGIDTATIDCSAITSNGDLDPIGCLVILTVPAPDPTQPPIFVAETFTNPTTGFFSLPVGTGNYDLFIEPISLPVGTLPPSPLSVSVSNGTLSTSGDFELCNDVANNTRRLLFVSQSSVTLEGELVDSSGNGVPGFVMLRNSSDGSFVSGTQTAPGTGAFEIPLGDLTYELEVDPFSVPVGFIAPPAVSVTAAGGNITVGNVSGVTYDAIATPPMTITVASASASVTGQITDSSGSPLQVEVVALDSADNFIASAFAGPQGNYTIPLAPGTYEIKVEPFSVPPGFAAPASEQVTLSGSQQIIVDFELASTAASVTGQVFFNDSISGSDIGIGCFVELRDAVSGGFIAGMWTEPNALDEFEYALPVGSGSFEVRVDPASMPPGLLAPSPVGFTVSVNSISGAVTISEDAHGSDADLTDGVIDFEASEAGTEFFGQVRADFGSGFTGTFGVVFLEIADGSQNIIAEAVTTPNGNFSFSLADGAYNLFVDPASLPNGFIAPPPGFMTVSGGSVSIDGTPVVTDATNRFNLDLGIAAASLTGEVLDSSANPLPGVLVMQFEAATGGFVNDSFTDASGRYTLPVVDGNYRIEIEPFSLPSGLIPPPPTDVNIAGTTVTLIDNSTLDLTVPEDLDLICAAPVGSITVDVVDEFGNPQFAEVEVTNAAGTVVVAQEFVAGAPVAIGLPAGAFLVRIPNFSLPPGLIAPGPVSLTVIVDGSTEDGSGSPGDGEITFTLSEAAAVVSGTVTFNGNPVTGAKITATADDVEVASSNTDINGTYFLELSVGDYEIALTNGLPTGAVQPAPFFLGVSDQDETLDWTLIPADGDISGTISLDGTGVPATVTAFEYDGTATEYFPITSVDTDENGVYAMDLPNGTFVLIAELDDSSFDPSTDTIVAPIPVESVVNTDSTTLDLTYFVRGSGAPGEPTSQVLVGDITAGGAAFDVPVILYHLSGTSPTELPVGLFDSEAGAYRIAIIEDATDYRVGIFEPELPPTGFTPPAAVDITVNSGSITGTGVAPDGSDFRLDFDITVDGVVVFGTVTDETGGALIGVEVSAFDPTTGTPGPLRFTNASGAYSFVLPVGTWEVELFGLPADVVAPPAAEIVVAGSGPFTIEIDGVSALDGNIDWVVPSAHAVLTGQLVSVNGASSFPVPGRIVARDASGIVSSVRSSTGFYEIFLPAGDLVVTAELDFPDPSTTFPLPYEVTVTDTGAVVELTNDFQFVTIDPSNPAGEISGQVSGDGVALEVELEIFTATGAFVGSVMSDSLGFWTANLLAGTYIVQVATDDLPGGFVGTSAFTIEVTEDGVSGPGTYFGAIAFSLDTVGTTVSGTITDALGAAAADVALFFFPADADLPLVSITDGSGAYTVTLPDGDYEIELDALTVPTGNMVPEIIEETYTGGPTTIDFALVASDGTVSGVLADDFGPVHGYVFAWDGTGYTFTTTNVDGTYTLELAAGDWTLTAEREDLAGSTGAPPSPGTPTLFPDPILVSVSSGTALTGQDFFFADPFDPNGGAFETFGTLVFGQGNPAIDGSLRVEKLIGGQWLWHSFYDAGSFGDPEGEGFVLVLDAGEYRLWVTEVQGAPVLIGPRELEVDATGILEGGMPASSLLIDVNTLTVDGSVTDATGGALSGIEIGAYSLEGLAPILIAAGTSDAGGLYSLELPVGSYQVEVLEGLATDDLTPSPVEAEVADNGGLEMTIDTVLIDPPAIDWMIETAHGNLNGTVTLDGVAIDAEIDVYEATTLIMTADAPNGVFDFNVPAGVFSVLARVDAISGEVLVPLPLEVTVEDTGSIEATTHAFDFVTSSPGSSQFLFGEVRTDGNPIPNAGLFLFTSTGALVRAITCDITGSFNANLALGDYILTVDAADIPVGYPGVARTTFTVDANGIFGPGVEGGQIAFDLDTAGVDVSGTVTDFTGAPVANAIVVFEADSDPGTPPISRFVATESDGTYALFLESALYEAWIDATSVPSGNVVPSFQEVDVLSTPVVVDFSLSQATATIEGTLTLNGQAPFLAEVILFDAADGSEVTYADVDSSGAYTMPVSAGSYIVFAETFEFDAATTLVPDPQAVTITAGQTVTVDFAWIDASTVTTQLLSVQVSQSGVTVDAELALTKEIPASSGSFVEYYEGNTLFDGNDYEFQIALTEGTYEIEVQFANGSPVTADLVELVVGTTDITVDGVALVSNLLEIDLDPPTIATGFLVTGTVTDSTGAAVSGLALEARDISTGSPMVFGTTDLGGNYELDVPAGLYDIVVTSGVPSGHVTPAPISIEVFETTGTFTAEFDGVSTVDGVLDYVLESGEGSLDGTITVDGVLTDGTIVVLEAGTVVLQEQTTSGAFDFLLPPGSFDVIAVVPGLDPAMVLPLPLSLAVATTGSVETTTHDFVYAPIDPSTNPGRTLTGVVESDGIGLASTLFVTLATGELVTQISTDFDGSWSVTLPPEDFLISLANTSLPANFQNEISTEFTVTADAITGPGIIEDFLSFVVNTTGIELSGSVLDHLGAAVADAVLFFELDDPSTGQTSLAWAITDVSGAYSVFLTPGFWDVFLDGNWLPGTAVVPVDESVEISSTPATLDWDLLEAVGTISGTVTLDGSPLFPAQVFIANPTTFDDYSTVDVETDGTYTIGAPLGDVAVYAEIDGDLSLLVTPDPIRETVSGGSAATAVDFAYVTATTETILDGRLLGGGQPGPGELIFVKENSGAPGTFDTFAWVGTSFDGVEDSFSIALTDGTYNVYPIEFNGLDITDGPYEVVISGANITIDTVLQSGTWDIDLGANPGAPTLAVSGTITDGAGLPLLGVTIQATPFDGTPVILSSVSDGSGIYLIDLPAGDYELWIESGSPADGVDPLPVEATVADAAGTLELQVGGSSVPGNTLDWAFGTAHGNATGAVTVATISTDAEILVFDGSTLVGYGLASGGLYDINLPVGTLTVVAIPQDLPEGMIAPAPLEVTVADTGSIEVTNYDFDFVAVDVANPGQTLSGTVTANGIGVEVSLVVTNGSGVVVAIVDTDEFGDFSVTLSPGNYTVSIHPDSIPPNATGISSTDLVVTNDEISGEGVLQGEISFGLTDGGNSLSGTVTDSTGTAVGSQVIFIEGLGSSTGTPGGTTGGDFETFAVTDVLGNYSVDLPDGDYQLFFDSSRLPVGQVGPGLVDVTMAGAPQTVDVQFVAADAEIRGAVTIDGVAMQNAFVAAWDVSTGEPVNFGITDSVGAYAFEVPAGTFTVLVIADDDMFDITALLIPDPVRVTPAGVDQTGVDFDFLTASSNPHQVITGHLVDTGVFVSGEFELQKEDSGNPGTFDLFAELDTDFDGSEESFTFALSPGTYTLEVTEVNNLSTTVGPFTLVVTGSDVTFDGQLVTGDLDIDVNPAPQAFDPTELTGTAIFAGAAVSSLDMALLPLSGGAPTTASTDANGVFTFASATDGEFWLAPVASTLPVGAAMPRLQRVTVAGGEFFPPVSPVGLPANAGTLSGTVTVDGVGTAAEVLVFDRTPSLVASTATDVSGAYSVDLPAGTYSLIALLDAPTGNEVPPVNTEIDFTTTATSDLAFTTSAASQVLTGTVAFSGTAAGDIAILAYTDTDPPVAIAIGVSSAVDGSYSMRIPDGSYLVSVAPQYVSAGEVLGEPVAVVVDGTGINGTDFDGNALASNMLDLDPYAATDAGAVRTAVRDLANAVMDGDSVALDAILDATTLWSGESKTDILTNWPSEGDWGSQVFQGFVVFLTNVDADNWTANLGFGRELFLTADGTVEEFRFDARANNDGALRLAVTRASVSDPWLVAGNGQTFEEASVAHLVSESFDGSSQFAEEVYFIVEESESVNLTAASVAGTGITDGTLTEQPSPDDFEWIAFVDSLSSGPSPFAADISLLVDGGDYTFTIDDGVSPQNAIITHNNPVASLYPTIDVTVQPDGSALIEWDEICAQLARAPSSVNLFVEGDDGLGGTIFVYEREDLPIGLNWWMVPSTVFTNGQFHSISIEVNDVGGGVQRYLLSVGSWPTLPSQP